MPDAPSRVLAVVARSARSAADINMWPDGLSCSWPKGQRLRADPPRVCMPGRDSEPLA